MKQFYLVWSPTGPTPPRVRHPTKHEARNVCLKMAREHPGADFYIVKALYRATVPNPIPYAESLEPAPGDVDDDDFSDLPF